MSMKVLFLVAFAVAAFVGCDGVDGVDGAEEAEQRDFVPDPGAPGPCQTNADCGPGGRCFAGQCSSGWCFDDEDCDAGESCEYLSWNDTVNGTAYCVPQTSIAKCEYRKATACTYIKGSNGGGGCSVTYAEVLHDNHGDGCGEQHAANDCNLETCQLTATNLWCYAKP